MVTSRIQAVPSSECRLLIDRVLHHSGYKFNRNYKYVIGNKKIRVKLTTKKFYNIVDISKNSLTVINNHSIRR
jgi:hypothetical protein